MFVSISECNSFFAVKLFCQKLSNFVARNPSGDRGYVESLKRIVHCRMFCRNSILIHCASHTFALIFSELSYRILYHWSCSSGSRRCATLQIHSPTYRLATLYYLITLNQYQCYLVYIILHNYMSSLVISRRHFQSEFR